MEVQSARGIIKQSVQIDMRRFKGRGNSTVLRAKFPPIRTNLESNRTSLTQLPKPSNPRSESYLLILLLRLYSLPLPQCTEVINKKTLRSELNTSIGKNAPG